MTVNPENFTYTLGAWHTQAPPQAFAPSLVPVWSSSTQPQTQAVPHRVPHGPHVHRRREVSHAALRAVVRGRSTAPGAPGHCSACRPHPEPHRLTDSYRAVFTLCKKEYDNIFITLFPFGL